MTLSRAAAIALALVLIVSARAIPQTAQPNGHQFNLTITNAAVVQLTVPQGTTFCTIGITSNPVNYDVGVGVSGQPGFVGPAPTTTVTGNGITANAGAILQFAGNTNCVNWGAIAQSANATANALFFR